MPGPFIHYLDPIYAKARGFYLWFYGTCFALGFLEVFFWAALSAWRCFAGFTERPGAVRMTPQHL